MSDQTDKLSKHLEPFGLSKEEASIFLLLLQKGSKSALGISRELHNGRTKVYRLLEGLTKYGLVTVKIDEVGKKFEAKSYKQLELLLTNKEYEVERLRKAKSKIFDELASIKGKVDKKSKVLYYTGKEGLKQVTWNSTKAKDKLYLFEILDMSAFLDYGFCEKVRVEFVKNKVKVFELTNQKNVPAWTNIEDFTKNYWECRNIDPKELEMRFEMLLYNDVYAMYSFQNYDIFCVEIYNQNLANMQKQIFEFMWAKAKKMKVGKGGKAEVRNKKK